MSWQTRLAEATSLPLLEVHGQEILLGFLACFVLQLVVSPVISSAVSKSYVRLKSLNSKTRRDWDIRVVAFVHAIYAVIAAVEVLFIDKKTATTLSSNKLFAYSAKAGSLFAYTTGYFLWDTVISTIYLKDQGPGFLIHALLCFIVFFASFRPFLQYFGANFLLWEASSPFLGLHWFFDKCNLTGSKRQLVNGIILLVTFFSARLVYGNMTGYEFFQELSTPAAKASVGNYGTVLYKTAMVTLSGLNVFWFYKMVNSVVKRFKPSKSNKKH